MTLTVCVWVLSWGVHLGTDVTDPLCFVYQSPVCPSSSIAANSGRAVKLKVQGHLVGCVGVGWVLVCVYLCVWRGGGVALQKRPIMVSILSKQSIHLDASRLIVLTLTAWCCLERRGETPLYLNCAEHDAIGWISG